MSSGNLRDEKRLLRLIAEERRRLGAELHDSLGQQVTGLAFLAKSLEQRLGAQGDAECASAAARLVEKANRLTEQAGYLAARLQEPETIGAGELPEALRGWALDAREAFGIECHVTVPEPVRLRDGRLATALFHLAREMIHEAFERCRRAEPFEVRVEETRGRLALSVTGAARENARIHPLAPLLRLRARLLGASLRASHDPAGKWTLRCTLSGAT